MHFSCAKIAVDHRKPIFSLSTASANAREIRYYYENHGETRMQKAGKPRRFGRKPE